MTKEEEQWWTTFTGLEGPERNRLTVSTTDVVVIPSDKTKQPNFWFILSVSTLAVIALGVPFHMAFMWVLS